VPVRSPGFKIVMIAKNTTNPIFVSARKGAEVAAKELTEKHGIPIQVVWMTPDGLRSDRRLCCRRQHTA
jgi:ribose transport system substrate-binding protein